MPDISMCPSDGCPKRTRCRRNEASGTRPSEWRQSYMAFTWRKVADGQAVLCDGFWPVEGWGNRDNPVRVGGSDA